MASTETISDPASGWDEEQCTAALAQMEQLQAQIDDLRLAIPRIIEPFHLPSKPSTFKLYAQGVERAQNGVKEFHESWRSSATERIFEHVRNSQTANTDLSAATSIPDHGWIAREKRNIKLRDGGQNEILEKRVSLDREDITRTVSDAQKIHPEIKFTLQDNEDIISIQFIANAVKLNFKISVERDANGNHSLNAECLGTTELSRAITRCIASRPQADDLNHLIDMIIAYKTVKGTSCAACAKFLDNAAVVPTARRKKQQTGASETPEPVWEALHESCL